MAFKDKKKQEAYTKALHMHEILIKEQSGRGLAYRKGWQGHPYDVSWCSYPVYAAGRDNRKICDKVKNGGE